MWDRYIPSCIIAYCRPFKIFIISSEEWNNLSQTLFSTWSSCGYINTLPSLCTLLSQLLPFLSGAWPSQKLWGCHSEVEGIRLLGAPLLHGCSPWWLLHVNDCFSHALGDLHRWGQNPSTSRLSQSMEINQKRVCEKHASSGGWSGPWDFSQPPSFSLYFLTFPPVFLTQFIFGCFSYFSSSSSEHLSFSPSPSSHSVFAFFSSDRSLSR